MTCIDPKYNCGLTVPSSCIPLQTNVEFTSFKKSEFSCDPNLNELLHKYDVLLKLLQDSIDLTTLDKKCLIFDKAVIKPNDLFQLLISTFCDIKDRVILLEDKVNNLDLMTETINIDLSCLGVASCDPSGTLNSHSILSVITTLVNGYCELKNSINN